MGTAFRYPNLTGAVPDCMDLSRSAQAFNVIRVRQPRPERRPGSWSRHSDRKSTCDWRLVDRSGSFCQPDCPWNLIPTKLQNNTVVWDAGSCRPRQRPISLSSAPSTAGDSRGLRTPQRFMRWSGGAPGVGICVSGSHFRRCAKSSAPPADPEPFAALGVCHSPSGPDVASFASADATATRTTRTRSASFRFNLELLG